jgi:hypothetical protein
VKLDELLPTADCFLIEQDLICEPPPGARQGPCVFINVPAEHGLHMSFSLATEMCLFHH